MLFTWLKGEQVGDDAFGNRYYVEKTARREAISGGVASTNPQRKIRRWVMYKGAPEASKVPPEWHAWLHRITDVVPKPGDRPVRPWQKAHQPNLTGTDLAYRPPGHTLKGGHRAKTNGDYEPWQPN